MADQRRWWKCWHTILDDDVMSNLPLDTWARWVRLNVWINAHGTKGFARVTEPAKALQRALDLTAFRDVQFCVTTLPGLQVSSDGKDPVTLSIRVKNWHKYQGDTSAERTRRWRAGRDGGETVTENGTTPQTGDGDKTRGDERRREEKERPPIVPRGDESFERFWSAYPRKVGKGAARKVWEKIHPTDGLLESILAAVSLQSTSDQWQKDGGQFIPHPATWLHQERWQDEAAVPSPPIPQIPEDHKSEWSSFEAYRSAHRAWRIPPTRRVPEWDKQIQDEPKG